MQGKIYTKYIDLDFFSVNSGSDFEDNLQEKWKDIKLGTKLKR